MPLSWSIPNFEKVGDFLFFHCFLFTHPVSNRRHDHDTMLAVMLAAKLLRRLGHHERATEYFNSLLSIQEKVLGTDHAEVIAKRTIHPCAISPSPSRF